MTRLRTLTRGSNQTNGSPSRSGRSLPIQLCDGFADDVLPTEEAFDRLDHGQYDAFTHATKALESTIKIICDDKGWTTGADQRRDLVTSSPEDFGVNRRTRSSAARNRSSIMLRRVLQ